MKVIKFGVIPLVLILMISGGLAVVAQGQTAITVPRLTLDNGTSGVVEARIMCAAPGECSGFNITLTFDPAVIAVDSAEVGPFLGEQVFEVQNAVDNVAGTVVLSAVAVGDLPAETEGVLFRLNITTLMAAQTPLQLTAVEVADGQGNPGSVAFTNGAITVLTGAGLPGVFSNPEWVIAFSTERDGNPEIYTMRPDGTDLFRVTDHPAADTYPAWSPDGEMIAFVSDRDGNPEIYIMNASGSGVIRLTDHPANDGYPAWSPRGNQIAFVSDRDGNPELYLMDTDGANVQRLTTDGAADSLPDWLPNAGKLAFVTARDGQHEVYTMTPQGQDLTRLTSGAGVDNWHPVWSPNGSQVAYVAGPEGNAHVFRMGADGTQVRQLTELPDRITRLDWSPDGQWIVFVSKRAGNSELFIMDAFGETEYRITDEPAEDYQPAWKPVAGPCVIRTDREDVPLRVGPGYNRSIFTMLLPGQDFFVIGQFANTDGSLWWQIDKTQIPGTEAAESLWVDDGDVNSSVSCPGVPLADAPPIRTPPPQITPTPPGDWGPCGSCDTCGFPANECVLAPDGQCLWDPRTCRQPTPPPNCVLVQTGTDWRILVAGPPAGLSANIQTAPNCGRAFFLPGTAVSVISVPIPPSFWTGTCPGASGSANPVVVTPTSNCTVIAVYQ